MKKVRKPSNSDFAATDPNFIAACKKAGTEATERQASKWRNGKGRAYKAAHGYEKFIVEED